MFVTFNEDGKKTKLYLAGYGEYHKDVIPFRMDGTIYNGKYFIDQLKHGQLPEFEIPDNYVHRVTDGVTAETINNCIVFGKNRPQFMHNGKSHSMGNSKSSVFSAANLIIPGRALSVDMDFAISEFVNVFTLVEFVTTMWPLLAHYEAPPLVHTRNLSLTNGLMYSITGSSANALAYASTFCDIAEHFGFKGACYNSDEDIIYLQDNGHSFAIRGRSITNSTFPQGIIAHPDLLRANAKENNPSNRDVTDALISYLSGTLTCSTSIHQRAYDLLVC